MKKMIICIVATFFINMNQSVFASHPYNVQFTVWNMTNKAIVMHCDLLQENSILKPAQPFTILPDDSPALLLTFQQFGKLVHCWVDEQPAWFDYSINSLEDETMEISPLSNQPNFHYDPDYQGALTYW